MLIRAREPSGNALNSTSPAHSLGRPRWAEIFPFTASVRTNVSNEVILMMCTSCSGKRSMPAQRNRNGPAAQARLFHYVRRIWRHEDVKEGCLLAYRPIMNIVDGAQSD